jgi:Epoxide hydrolase N terminus
MTEKTTSEKTTSGPLPAPLPTELDAGAEDNTIRPFTVEIPEADLRELRARIAATRWPDKETVEDDSQGVPLAMMQDLARYWLTEYDWRKSDFLYPLSPLATSPR